MAEVSTAVVEWFEGQEGIDEEGLDCPITITIEEAHSGNDWSGRVVRISAGGVDYGLIGTTADRLPELIARILAYPDVLESDR